MLVTSATLLLFAGGCSDDATNPTGEGRYRITAYLLEDFSTVSVRIVRLDSRDPEAPTAMITVDGLPMQLDPMSSAEEAIFGASLQPMLGQSHSVVIALAGNHASTTLVAPSQPSELAITSPPPDSLYYEPGSPLQLEWQYDGDAPGEFSLLVTVLAGIHTRIYADSLSPGSRSTEISGSTTSSWIVGQQAFVTLDARRRDSIAGDLAADGSTATVIFATADLTLTRR